MNLLIDLGIQFHNITFSIVGQDVWRSISNKKKFTQRLSEKKLVLELFETTRSLSSVRIYIITSGVLRFSIYDCSLENIILKPNTKDIKGECLYPLKKDKKHDVPDFYCTIGLL